MITKPAHLVERAAERLLHLGLLDGSMTPLPRPMAATADVMAPEPPRRRPHDAGQVQEADRLPGTPPRSAITMAELRRAGMFDWSRRRHRILEEFRLAQQQLLRAAFAPMAEPGLANLVMVTSARPSEGKSFVSLNLACSIALQGDHNVLLIDCDPSPQSMCQALGLADASGILDLATSPKPGADDTILRTEVENLSVLPIGRERDRSSELFASRDMTHLLRQLGRRYAKGLLILDAAPSLSTSDPAALASTVGQILMVIEAERTQREDVETALELLQACPSIMLVLNKAHPSDRHAFGAYSGSYSS